MGIIGITIIYVICFIISISIIYYTTDKKIERMEKTVNNSYRNIRIKNFIRDTKLPKGYYLEYLYDKILLSKDIKSSPYLLVTLAEYNVDDLDSLQELIKSLK